MLGIKGTSESQEEPTCFCSGHSSARMSSLPITLFKFKSSPFPKTQLGAISYNKPSCHLVINSPSCLSATTALN